MPRCRRSPPGAGSGAATGPRSRTTSTSPPAGGSRSSGRQTDGVTERKPPGVSWETWIDRQVREGMERGDFDDLPGHGKPISGLDRPRDELWWVKDKLRREGVSYLPPTLAVRKDLEDARAAILASTQ